MRTRVRIHRLATIGFCAIGGMVSPADERMIMAHLTSLQQVVRDPGKFEQLISDDLQSNGCDRQVRGGERCSYLGTHSTVDRAMVLSSLISANLHHTGDIGGGALWLVSPDVCFSPQIVAQLFHVKPKERPAPTGEPLAGSTDSPPGTQYIYENLNPEWGSVRVQVTATKVCVGMIELEMSR